MSRVYGPAGIPAEAFGSPREIMIFDDMLFAEFRVGAGYGLGEEVCQRIPKLVQVGFGQVEHTRRRFESGEVHIKFSHTPIDGEHGLKNAVATGKSLVFHADKRTGRGLRKRLAGSLNLGASRN